MRTHSPRAALLAIALLALPLAGCVENVDDLRARLSGEPQEAIAETAAPADDLGQSGLTESTPAANLTKPKPPVARIAVYGAGGALVFKSSFAADETKVPGVLPGGETITFTASDSEAVDKRATVVDHVWTFQPLSAPKTAAKDEHAGHGDHGHHAMADLPLEGFDAGHDHGSASAAPTDGPMTMTGTSVQHAFPADGGVWMVALTVKDSLNGTDTQAVLVGVNPAPVTKSVTFEGTITLGNAYTVGTTDSSEHVFNVSASVDDKPAKALKAVLKLSAKDARGIDFDLAVLDPAGNEVATSETPSASDESIEISGLDAGDWKAVVMANLAAMADYTLTVDVTYQPEHPDVAALFGGDDHGHGGHAH